MAALTGRGGKPIELTPGGGDLRRSSLPLRDFLFGQTQLWNRTVSHRNIWSNSQPAVASVVNKIVRQIARLPIKLYQEGSQKGSKDRVREGDVAQLLRTGTSNANQPPVAPISWKQALLLPTAVEGNGLMRKMRDQPAGTPTALRKIDGRFACPEFDTPSGPPVAWWIADPETRSAELVPASDIIHVAWDSFERGIGISPLQHLGTTLTIEDAAQEWQVNNLRSASRPPGVVSLSDEFLGWDATKRQELLDQGTAQVREHYTGPENAGKPLVLPPGMTWTDAGFSAHDAELIRQRKLAREEVCIVYDMPEVMLGVMENATLANVEVWGRLLFTHVLGPWIVLLEETLQAHLIDVEPAWDGLFVEFELAEVLRGDTLKEITALRLAVMAGLMTINEARATRNLPALDFKHCDEPLIPANNMLPISLAGNTSTTGGGGETEDDKLTSAAVTNLLTAPDNDAALLAERLLAGASA